MTWNELYAADRTRAREATATGCTCPSGSSASARRVAERLPEPADHPRPADDAGGGRQRLRHGARAGGVRHRACCRSTSSSAARPEVGSRGAEAARHARCDLPRARRHRLRRRSKSGAGSGSTTAAATTSPSRPGRRCRRPPTRRSSSRSRRRSARSSAVRRRLASKEATPQDLAAAKKALGEFADELEKINPPADGRAGTRSARPGDAPVSRTTSRGSSPASTKAKNAQDAIAALFGAPADPGS